MRIFSYIIFLIILLLGLTFACLNADSVKVNFYISTWDLPLSLLLVIVLGIGIVLGFLSTLGVIFRLKRKIHKLTQRVHTAEKEVENLRSIPLKDDH